MTLREVFQHNVTKTAALMSSLTHGGKVKRERGSDYFWGGGGDYLRSCKCYKKYQGSRLTFQFSSLVASERFDFTSQNKFSLARLFLHNLILCSIRLIFSRVKYCKHASL